MKKTIAFAGLALLAAGAFAQTNLQLMYDFGEGREYVTSTLEMFKSDNWGNTFFFVDYDYNFIKREQNGNEYVAAPSSTYFEIERCLNFWSKTALAPLSLHVEYNGGFFSTGLLGSQPITSSILAGVDYFMHSASYSNTLNLKVLYKKYVKDTESIPVQFSAVWRCQDLFGLKGLSLTGFADFFGRKASWMEEDGTFKDTEWSLVSEPQLWYSVGQFFGCDNLSIGGEVELGYNFAGNPERGFKCNPCAGLKWNF